MSENEEIWYQEEVQMGEARWGSVAVVIGEILLGMDLILLSFVYSSVRDGSWFWVWWFLSQGALGLILLLRGENYSHSHVR